MNKQDKLKQDWVTHNKWLKSIHMQKITFEEYLDYAYGRIKYKRPFEPLKVKYNYKDDTKKYPSNDERSCHVYKNINYSYSGSRNLIGIGTMHKSNMIPIFDKESAEDIAKMRRN
jgi:hypothetical protein